MDHNGHKSRFKAKSEKYRKIAMTKAIITKCETRPLEFIEAAMQISLELYILDNFIADREKTICFYVTLTVAKELADLLSTYSDDQDILCFQSPSHSYDIRWSSPKTVRWGIGEINGLACQEYEFGTSCMMALASVIHATLRGSSVPNTDKEIDLMAGAKKRTDDNLRKLFGY